MKNIDLGDITVHNLKQLKKLNQIVFPVSYNDKFYKDILEIGPLAKLGKQNDHQCSIGSFYAYQLIPFYLFFKPNSLF